MINPYRGCDFFSFFSTMLSRLIKLVSGGSLTLASDELQVLLLSFIAISCCLLGCFLVLKKMSMLANALSHTILLGIIIAYLLFSLSEGMDMKILIFASIISAAITTLFTQALHSIFRLQQDAAIGLVFTSLFALGILLATLFTRNAHIGTEAVMGNVDALHFDDLKISLSIMIINLFFITFFYKQLVLNTFDKGFALTIGQGGGLYQYFFMVLVAATSIAAFRAVGVILVLAFFVGPFITARLLSKNLKTLLLVTPALGVTASIIGVALSRHVLSVYGTALSTGALVVSIIGVLYFLIAISICLRHKPQRAKR